MVGERDHLRAIARYADYAERYDDMRSAMYAIAQMPEELSQEERKLFSTAYKNVINMRRPAWRVVRSSFLKENGENPMKIKARDMMQTVIESEIEEVSNEIINLLEKHLIPNAKSPDYKVFLYKTLGDYKRYLAEIASREERNELANDSLIAYKTATDIAQDLPATDQLRLGLSLNFSVFYYEILRNTEKACEMAKDALSKAEESGEDLRDDAHKDIQSILKLLRDNITLWTSGLSEND